jgi:serine phosphatase RsbU (regulator of sigma subunit)/CBS domain-containing protein
MRGEAGGAAAEQGLHAPIREIMADAPASTAAEAPVVEAAALMNRLNIGAVLVCREGLLVGILTERDLLRAAGRGQRLDTATVADLMTPTPVTISAEATWEAAADLMVQRGVRHLPVVEGGRPVGMLSLRDLLQHRSGYLEALVRQRTLELERKNAALQERERLMQFHLTMAGRIQRQLLPPGPPEVPSLTFALAYHPLDLVSGDYYDFAVLPSGRLGILLADASGHGVPAAFVSVMAKTAFHAYAQGIESPASLLRTMNEHLVDLMADAHFISMFYGVLDHQSRRLEYALGGHPRPLWYRRGKGQVHALDAEGPVLGLLGGVDFQERGVQLDRGDLVLIYSDGVTECRNDLQEEFGPRRLEAVLAAHAGSAQDAVARLNAELALFRGTEPFHDDVTCIALSVEA